MQPTTPFMNDSRDPEPFWTAQDAEVQDLDGHQVGVGRIEPSACRSWLAHFVSLGPRVKASRCRSEERKQ